MLDQLFIHPASLVPRPLLTLKTGSGLGTRLYANHTIAGKFHDRNFWEIADQKPNSSSHAIDTFILSKHDVLAMCGSLVPRPA